MSEDSNTGQGRISGRPDPGGDDMANAGKDAMGRIPGKSGEAVSPGGKIAGSNIPDNSSENPEVSYAKKMQPESNAKTRKQRIALATSEKGLKSIPPNFGDTDGDWQIIESENLFEVLYLDHEQLILINPDVVRDNFIILENFWKEKRNLWESGSGQVRKSIEDKYGARNLANCIKKMALANEQLFTLEKISAYSEKLRVRRMQNAEEKLGPLLRMMTKNGEAEPVEIEGIIEEGLKYDLTSEEVAIIIKNVIEEKGFKPDGVPTGGLLSERLLSVSWMTDKLLQEKQAKDEANKRAGREILDGVYAYNTEEIGEIIFNHEADAKRDIADGLLKNSIDYFSTAKARQFVEIVNAQKNEHLRYLQIVYRLKPQLPYRFSSSRLVRSPKELCETMFETPETFKLGKEQFKNGYPEVWFLETDKEAFKKVAGIRATAENADLAFLAFLYTFSPALPYRLAGGRLVSTPEELCSAINTDKGSWEAGKTELFDASITTWLSTVGQAGIVTQWDKVKAGFTSREDIGLEYFLHLLVPDLPHSKLAVDKETLHFPKIQSGQLVRTALNFSNTTRGCAEVHLSFSKDLPGIGLSADQFLLNNVAGQPGYSVDLEIDSNMLLKGVDYQITVIASTFEQQRVEIPVQFRIVFPKNAFMLQVVLYAGIVGVFFALLRVLLSTQYPDWLNSSYSAFLRWDQAISNLRKFAIFGWVFLLLAGGSITGLYFFGKYLIRKR